MLKKGGAITLHSKAVLYDAQKKQLSAAHTGEFRYLSSNKKVATVTAELLLFADKICYNTNADTFGSSLNAAGETQYVGETYIENAAYINNLDILEAYNELRLPDN